MSDSLILTTLNKRDALLQVQQKMYVSAAANINMRYRELLRNDFGITLFQNCVSDAAGEVVRRYFNTADYYITIDQMVRRILLFSYEDDFDPLSNSEDARKAAYNMTDSPQFSSFLHKIEAQNRESKRKLFEKEKVVSKNGKVRSQYKDHKMINAGKEAYRIDHGTSGDELTGVKVERLDVDHVQAAATATYNSRYLRDETAIEDLKKFYNSARNFEMLGNRANGSKGDVRVYADNSKSDITYKATARQYTEAVCHRWEKCRRKETREYLLKNGYLGPDGKVPADVRKKMEDKAICSMNGESEWVLRGLSYMAMVEDAELETEQAISKIIIGQVVYYILPPTLFEIRQIICKKNMTLDKCLKEIQRAGDRIIRYAKSKLGVILKNVVLNTIHKFLKSFFDIIISVVKETVRRLVTLVKSLALSLIQSIKILTDRKASPTEKADAITNIFAATITNVVLQVLFEVIEDALGINDFVTEPLQWIVSILVTNLVMLILQKADLFHVRYGILTANMEQIFWEERQHFLDESERNLEEAQSEMTYYMDELNKEISEIENSIKTLDLYADDVLPTLERINNTFAIGIDFQTEWRDFCHNA